MPSTERTERLFANIVRLRDTQRRVPDDEGLATVLSDLEQQLGPTVTRNLAAKLLGVSHTGLQRWIDAGDVPLILDARGRPGVPTRALLRLHDRLRAQREAGRSHVIERVVRDARGKARHLESSSLLTEWAASTDDEAGHDRATRRARAYHAVVARRLRRADVQEAQRQVRRWVDEGRIDARYAQAWDEILRRPLPEIRAFLRDDSARADDLRQNSPLGGLLSEAERRAILQRVR